MAPGIIMLLLLLARSQAQATLALRPMIFALKAGDFQPTLNNLALPATQVLITLLLVAATAMARSAIPGTGTGGRLHPTLRRLATPCGVVLA